MEIPSAVEAEPQSLPLPFPFASRFLIFFTIMVRFLRCPVQGHELDFDDPVQSVIFYNSVTSGETIPQDEYNEPPQLLQHWHSSISPSRPIL